jgi:ubiquinone biosynthesis protein UbiJ
MTLLAVGLRGTENMLNRWLALDPEFTAQLQALEGRLLKLEISGMGSAVYIVFEQGRIKLSDVHETIPELTVRGAPLALLSALRTRDPLTALQSGSVEMHGNVQLAEKLKNIFSKLDIDLEEHVSRLIGDWPAHRLGLFVRGLSAWGRHARSSLGRSVGEWLQEESRQLPARIEVENFMAAIDSVRDATDRLEARLNLLQTRRSPA